MILKISHLYKTTLFLIFIVLKIGVIAQSIEIISLVNNPVEINPFTGGNVIVNFKYTSETGSTGNNIFIGLEILDSNNNYKSSITGKTLLNQQAGNNTQSSVDLFISSYNTLSGNLTNGDYYQVKAILYESGTWVGNAWAGYWNTNPLIIQDTSGISYSTNTISKGADISWMTEMEFNGYSWKDNNGNTRDLMPLLTDYELNAIRLRVWVDPNNSGANGWCDIDDLVNKSKLADAENLDIMICIHYSDWWADPSTQTKPAAWVGLSVSQLETAVYNHTYDILNALGNENIVPKWVQIGNETNDGMLWPTGKASTGGFSNYAKFINAGTSAVKNYNSNIKTIIHLANGNDNGLFLWNIDGLLNNGLLANRIDVIGMSLYPDESNWISLVDDAYNNTIDLQSRYSKDVMVVEVGFSNNRPDISYQFLTYIIEKTRQANGLGVLYWEPIAHGNFTNYSKGAWDLDGSPSIAMDAFKDLGIQNVEDNNFLKNENFKIIPNPTKKFLKIELNNQDDHLLLIFNIIGEKLIEISNYKDMQKIDVSKLKNGIYIIKINNSEHKFIKL
ncbi:MAG: glycosyl hydrolase 53 family protein [Flavobacteriales bacterium]|nr:glycosyl hydrolase 53 family protein [Flavobacteriales bacterium]